MPTCNIRQDAWTANDYVVQDCVDHEVYKMVGRHGVDMATRGIAAAEALRKYGFGCKRKHVGQIRSTKFAVFSCLCACSVYIVLSLRLRSSVPLQLDLDRR